MSSKCGLAQENNKPELIGTAVMVEGGVNFVENLNLEQIKAKAEKENKFIFIYCYATWCAPCKIMSNEIFPKDKVASFMNKSFINLKLQMDITKSDNQLVKGLRRTAQYVEDSFKVSVFPTYIILSPKGKFISKFTGAISDEKTFILTVVDAVKSDAYYTSMSVFEQWKTDMAKVKKMVYNARQYDDKQGEDKLSELYIKSMDNVLTPENLVFIKKFTNDSKDIGFKLFLDSARVINSKTRPYFAETVITDVIMSEDKEILLLLSEKKSTPDWSKVYSNLRGDYSEDISLRTLSRTKLKYYKALGDSSSYVKEIVSYVNNLLKNVDPLEINNFAWLVYENSTVGNSQEINAAKDWMALLLQNQDSKSLVDQYCDTYAHLLFKNGKTQEAIFWEKKAIDVSQFPESILVFKKNLSMMEKTLKN